MPANASSKLSIMDNSLLQQFIDADKFVSSFFQLLQEPRQLVVEFIGARGVGSDMEQ